VEVHSHGRGMEIKFFPKKGETSRVTTCRGREMGWHRKSFKTVDQRPRRLTSQKRISLRTKKKRLWSSLKHGSQKGGHRTGRGRKFFSNSSSPEGRQGRWKQRCLWSCLKTYCPIEGIRRNISLKASSPSGRKMCRTPERDFYVLWSLRRTGSTEP